MTERSRSGGEDDHRHERHEDLPPYRQAVRFAGEQPAGRAFHALQAAIFADATNDLSVYRLGINDRWYVAVLGLPPPPQLSHHLSALLTMGEPVELPPELWQALAERRRQAMRQAPWVERHFRPPGGS